MLSDFDNASWLTGPLRKVLVALSATGIAVVLLVGVTGVLHRGLGIRGILDAALFVGSDFESTMDGIVILDGATSLD